MDKILRYFFVLFSCLGLLSVAAYPNNEIKYIGKFTLINNLHFIDDSVSKPIQFHCALEFTPAISSYSRINTGMRIISGYSFSKNHFIGLGAGLTVYYAKYNNLELSKFRYYPLFIRYSKTISVNGIAPLIYGDIGSQIQPKGAKEHSLLFYRFGIGINYFIKNKRIASSFEYANNRARFTHNYYSSPELSYWYNNHTFSFCLSLFLK